MAIEVARPGPLPATADSLSRRAPSKQKRDKREPPRTPAAPEPAPAPAEKPESAPILDVLT